MPIKAIASIESKVKARTKRKRIQDIVIKSLFAATAIGLAVAAPNSVQLLRYVRKYVEDSPKLDRRISQAMYRLMAKGLVVRDKDGRLALTAKGERLGATLDTDNRFLQKPLHWDGKWRIVIFDIWEKRRAARDRLRITLERNGFVKIQNSVWVYPYDCEELFAFLRTHLSLGQGILYIVAEEIENDAKLKKHFGLRIAS